MRLDAVVLVACGCGRIAFEPVQDGSTDAGDAECSPWSAPVEVTALTTADDDWEPTLSPDGALLVFSRVGATRVIYAAPRTGATLFGTPTAIEALVSAGNETGPAWAPTGDQLLFSSDRLRPTGQDRLWTSSYTNGAFQPPIEVAELANVAVRAPALGGDGLELYYTDDPTPGVSRIFRATRATSSAPWVPTGPEAGIDLPDGGSGWASVSADSLTIYFEGKVMNDSRLWRATRASVGERFTAPRIVEELAAMPDLVAAGDPEISRDGTMLLFAMDRVSTATGFDIFISTRSCPQQ